MTQEQTIIALLIAIVVSVGVGFQIGVSVNHQPPSALPSNFDAVAAVAGEKAARAESAAFLELLQRQTTALANCAKAEGSAH